LEEAIGFYKRSLNINPKHMESVYGYASVLGRQGKQQESLDLLRSYLPECGGDALLHVRIAEIYSLMGSFEQAVEHFNYALKLSPHHQLAQQGLEVAEKALNGDEEDVEGGLGNQVLLEGLSQNQDNDEEEEETEEEELDAEMSADI
jgi:tetratricopeptide (TPR) repeat protein